MLTPTADLYEDFELTAVPGGPPHTSRLIARASAGQTSAQTTLDPTAGEWRAALHAIEQNETSEALLLELGQRLFDALFPDSVQALYRASLGHAKGEGKGLRLRLRLTEAPELAALPWEYLYDPQRDIFVGISADTPLSRFIEPAQTFPPPPPLDEKLRILTVMSQPQDLPPLNGDAIRDTMDRALQRLKAQNRLEEIPPLRHAVRADIAEALREHRPHVLHLVSPGAFDAQRRRGLLYLEDPDHYAIEMSGRSFRELLEGHTTIRLVILDVGEGAARDAGDAMIGIGPQLVSRGVPAVVAKQYPIADTAAVNLTREFYRALTHRYPIDVALAEARRAIYLDDGPDRRDWGVPVLFMRDRDGMLFAPPAEEPDQPEPDRVPAPDPAALQRIQAIYVQSKHRFVLSQRSRLLEILKAHFDLDTLREICLELGVDFEDLKGETRSAKALDLILFAERHSKTYPLIEAAVRRRPEADW